MKILSRKRGSRRSVALLVAISQFAITLAPALHPILHPDPIGVAVDSETALRVCGSEYRSDNHDTCFLCRVTPETQAVPDCGRTTPAGSAVELGFEPIERPLLSQTLTSTNRARAPPSLS
jgi:hypothetical protein